MLTNEMYESFLDEREDTEHKESTDRCASQEIKNAEDEVISNPQVKGSVFPCLSDEEAQRALEMLVHVPKVHVKVAGGILRHDFT